MANLKPYVQEFWLLVANLVFLLFVLTNVNSSLGNAYLWFTGGSLFLLFLNILVFDKNVSVTFNKGKTSWTSAILQAVMGWVLLLGISYFAMQFVDPLKANFGSIVAQMSAANPAFSDSVIINLITVSFAIGFAETQFFSRLLELVGDSFGFEISKNNMRKLGMGMAIAFISILFLIFHLTAKGVTQISALTIVFIMMVISLYMVVLNDGETKSAVIMHVLANFVAAWVAIQSGGLSL